MNFTAYQEMAMSTRLETADEAYALFGLIGEVGELYGYIAKVIRDDSNGDDHQDYVKKELGDILWFIAAIAQDHGLSLEDVAQTNVEKLQSRKQRGTLQGSGDER